MVAVGDALGDALVRPGRVVVHLVLGQDGAHQLAQPAAHVQGRDGKLLTYTASIGIAQSQPDWDLPTLLMHADQAMYQAKRAGGGNWRIFTDTTPPS